MPTVVIDASALAAVLFAEPRADQITALIDGKNLTAPALIRYEVISVALKKLRQQPEDRRLWFTGIRRYAAFYIVEQIVPLELVLGLADEIHLTAYDASYLWLARHLGVPLITLDGELATAAG